MNFLEYIVMFDKIIRDNNSFFIGENGYCDFKIGDIVFVHNLNFAGVDENVFVIIEENCIAVPISYLYYISSDLKNVDFVYQLGNDKIIKKIGKINSNIISDYKKKYILLNRNMGL